MIKINTGVEIKGDKTRVSVSGPYGVREYKLTITSKGRMVVYSFYDEQRALARYFDALGLLVGTVKINPADEWHENFLKSL